MQLSSGDLSPVDRETLVASGRIKLHDSIRRSPVLFSDGRLLGSVTKTDGDEFVASLVEISDCKMYPAGECRLRLALQNLYSLGHADQDSSLRLLNVGSEDGIVSAVAGKDFHLVTSPSGKVWYKGKASSLGLKSPMPLEEELANHWSQLPIAKCQSVTRCATGHEGQHAVFIDDTGSVFFVGTSRRGEDGDLSKASIKSLPAVLY